MKYPYLYLPTLLVGSLMLGSNVLAQVSPQVSPKGRIDIAKGQAEDQQSQAAREGASKKDLIFKNSQPLNSTISGPEYISGEQVCEVEISTSYFQSGDSVKVEALIDNGDCAASNGKYKVKVRTRDESGEASTETYEEIWSRDNSESVTAKHSYSMGDGVELVNARIQMPSRDYCTCIDRQLEE